MKKYFIFLTIIGFASLQTLHATDVFSKMSAEKICVAYETTKGMFFVTNVNVIGINCSVTIEKSEKMIRIIIPVSEFDSGLAKRDSEVSFLLGGPSLVPMRYEFSLPKDIQNSARPIINGNLYIKEIPNSVILNLSKKENVTQFQFNTKFSTLGVKVNSVGPGGIIANPTDDLIIYGQVPNNLISKSEK
ncbi:MAG: hypothetical protein O9264_17470 [Leptospira sp.]|nr:hypothetical protein [Leptospira sp.]